MTTNNLHNPAPPGPNGADFLTRMDAESAEIGRQFKAGAINGTEAARRLNALGGDGWWDEGPWGVLRWTIDGHPLGPVCWRCHDTQTINGSGAVPARCPSCPTGNDRAAIIAIRREAMKLRDLAAEGGEPKSLRASR